MLYIEHSLCLKSFAMIFDISVFAPFLGPLLPRFIRRRLFGPDHINFFMEVIHQAIKQRQTNKQVGCSYHGNIS